MIFINLEKQVALLPAVTLTSRIFFTSFFGALGLLMALPLTVIAKNWIEEVVFNDILDRWNPTSEKRDISMWVELKVTCALLGLGTGDWENHYTFIYAYLLRANKFQG